MTSSLLEVRNLNLILHKGSCSSHILRNLSFSIYPGEIVGLMGESGCGKSMTASAILGLIPSSADISGDLIFEGKNLLKQLEEEMEKIRGNRLNLIMQDPALALNPLIPVGKQLIEGILHHKKMNRKEGEKEGIRWLERVGIGDAAARMKQYPHEISGGMKQRILIAMALSTGPSLIIADEPTTALDVTIQAQILDLLLQLQEEEKMSLLLITHDLGVVARCCQRAMVMYGGQIVETGSVDVIFKSPQHPYMQALLKSRLSLALQQHPLICLEGHPPRFDQEFNGCSFAPRCPHAMKICEKQTPPFVQSNQSEVLCWLPMKPRVQKVGAGHE